MSACTSYSTAKYTRIQDWKLALAKFIMIGLILGYIFVWRILYKNCHFLMLDVKGSATMSIQQPTVHGCNPRHPGCLSDFRPLTELPYCKEYTGNSTVVKSKDRSQCRFADQHTLAPEGTKGGEFLVPTRIDTISQTKGCKPSEKNGYTCKNEWTLGEKTKAYIADVERSTIMITHSFKRKDLAGMSTAVKGSYRHCPDKDSRIHLKLEENHRCTGKKADVPIQCITKKCAKDALWGNHAPATLLSEGTLLRGATGHKRSKLGRQQTLPANLMTESHLVSDVDGGEHDVVERPSPAELNKEGVFMIPSGDIFTVKKLLEEAGLSLDESFNKDGESLRSSGTSIHIDIVYSNMYPWVSAFGSSDVTYVYKIHQRPLGQMKEETLAHNAAELTVDRRIVEDRHGLLISVAIGGQFGFFSVQYFTISIVAALSLLTVSTMVVDKLAECMGYDLEEVHPDKKDTA